MKSIWEERRQSKRSFLPLGFSPGCPPWWCPSQAVNTYAATGQQEKEAVKLVSYLQKASRKFSAHPPYLKSNRSEIQFLGSALVQFDFRSQIYSTTSVLLIWHLGSQKLAGRLNTNHTSICPCCIKMGNFQLYILQVNLARFHE